MAKKIQEEHEMVTVSGNQADEDEHLQCLCN